MRSLPSVLLFSCLASLACLTGACAAEDGDAIAEQSASVVDSSGRGTGDSKETVLLPKAAPGSVKASALSVLERGPSLAGANLAADTDAETDTK